MIHNRFVRYSVAPVSVGLSLLCRLALNPYLHDASPFMYFFVAIIVSGWLGGLGPGLIAAGLSGLVVDYFYLEPLYTILGGGTKENIQIISFLILGAVVSAIIARMRLEKRRAEQARRTQEKEKDLLQSVMNGTKNSHLVYLDRDFNFVRVNEAYARTCGYKPEDMIGKNHFALYPHEENEAIFARVRDTGEPAEFHDKPFVFPDQPERGITYWDWTLNPVRDGSENVEGLVFSLVETTERKRAEEALRDSAQRLTLAQQAARIGSFDWNIQTNVNIWSPELEAMYGLQPGEFGRTQTAWEQLVHPEDRQSAIAAVNRAFETDEPVEGEWRVQWRDGSVRWIFGRFQVLKDESGKPLILQPQLT